MNLSKGTEMLLEELKFVATADVVKPLPWRSVSSIATEQNHTLIRFDS